MNIDDEPRSGVGLMKADDVLLSTVRSCSSMSPTIRLAEGPPFSAKTYSRKRRQLSNTWARQLDRVNVLGSNDYGHTGSVIFCCVNALSWARNGELLISSGDDYNATVAGDKQVRVFDVGDGVGRSPTGSEMTYTTAQACIRLLRCHSGRTKRIVTEDSPDLFLTVAEDGTSIARAIDYCVIPPYTVPVCGWWRVALRALVITAFSSDAVYLYSTRDEPGNSEKSGQPSILAPNVKHRKRTSTSSKPELSSLNFLGPCDEYVTSGSDDGNFFIWDKISGEVVDIFEGDENIVNVIEGHPTLPLIAVSGIDTTVK
ncbi:hypothetical protein ID866_5321, partial [Astraeus odoratus]